MVMKYSKLLLSIATVIGVSACNSGNSGSTQANTMPSNYNCTTNGVCGVNGVLSAQYYSDLFNSVTNTNNTTQGLIIPIMKVLGIAADFGAPVTPIIGVMSIGVDTNELFKPKTPSTAALMANYAESFQTQLNNLQEQVINDQNYFYSYMVTTSGNTVSTAYNSLLANLNTIGGNSSQAGTTAYDYNMNSNLSDGSSDNYANGFPVATGTATSSSDMNNLNKLVTATSFASAMNNLSNSVVCTSYESAIVYPYNTAPCQTMSSASSNLITLLNALQEQLTIKLQVIQQGESSSNEVTSLLYQYNNQVAAIFSQVVSAMQMAYIIETNNNLLNYLAVINGESGNQISPYNQIGNITYNTTSNTYSCNEGCTSFYITNNNPTTESSIYQEVFTQASQNLVAIYAHRFNTLIEAVIPYIVSDRMISTQSFNSNQLQNDWTTTQVSYNGNTYKVKSAQALYNQTATALGLSGANWDTLLPGGGWNTSSVFYQYAGFYDYLACASGNNCVPFFPNTGSAIYNGNSFSYYAGISPSSSGAPATGLLLTELTTISYSNSVNPQTTNNTNGQANSSQQTFTTWFNSDNSAAYPQPNWGNGGTTGTTLGNEDLHWYLQFPQSVNLSNVSYYEAGSDGATEISFNKVADKGSSSANNILSSPDGANYITLNVNNNLQQNGHTNDTYTSISINPTVETANFICSAPIASGGTIAYCVNMLNNTFYSLNFVGTGGSFWQIQWDTLN